MLRVAKRVVIALSDSPRIDDFLEHNREFSFEVFEAFDGRSGQKQTEFDTERAAELIGRPLVGGEIGCAISHFRLLKQFAADAGDDSDLMLVAEDDARLDEHFEDVLERILKHSANIGLILLAEAWGGVDFGSWISIRRNPTVWLGNMSLLAKPVGPLNNPYKHRLGHVKNYIWGSGLYVVSRQAAKQIVSLSDGSGRSYWLADGYHHFATNAGVDVTVCRPGLAAWAGESSIEGRVRESSLPNVAKSSAVNTAFRKIKARIAVRTRLERLIGSVDATRKDLRKERFPNLDK